jgi:hypothetical protein
VCGLKKCASCEQSMESMTSKSEIAVERIPPVLLLRIPHHERTAPKPSAKRLCWRADEGAKKELQSRKKYEV